MQFMLLKSKLNQETVYMTDDNPVSDNANMVMNVLGHIRQGSRYSQIVTINHDYHVPGLLQK